jgi:DNA-directed RNA polymerase subunit RPC12/RpoP
MTGGRKLYTCATCGKCFFYWVQDTTPQPRVKCYFCGIEEFPHGEPPAVPAPVAVVPVPEVAAVPPAEGTLTPVH